MSFKTLAVVNPNSANGTTEKLWPSIADEIAKYVRNFEYVFTSSPEHAPELTRQGLKEGFEMIVAVGGDGTNNEVVNGFFDGDDIINPDAVFANITQGTGGDLRRTLGVPREFAKVAPLLAGDKTKTIDVGQMAFIDHKGNKSNRYFINIVSFGIGGEVDARVNKTTKIFGGFASFFWASLVSVMTYKNKIVKLVVDGKDIGSHKIFNCAVANGQYFGGGMQVAPYAKMDDGKLDIIIIGDLSMKEKLVDMNSIYKGRHVDLQKVECLTGEVIEAYSDQEVLLDVDGEQPGKLDAKFTIRKGALKVKTFID